MAGAVAVVVTVAFLADIPEVSAGAPSISVNTSQVVAPAEYFTDVFGDAMDFNNGEDFETTSRYKVVDGAAGLADGKLVTAGSGQIFFLRHDNGSWPLAAARDSRSRPLDAGFYNRISFQMHSSFAGPAALSFRNCFEPGCADGTKYFMMQAGWHTYDLDMTGGGDREEQVGGAPPVVGTPWSGYIGYLFMSPAFNTPNKPTLTFDDFRIYHGTSTIGINFGSGGTSSTDLWSQVEGQGANRVGRIGTAGSTGVDGGLLRPGQTVRFWTSDSGASSAQSGAVTMGASSRPSPAVLSPSENGGGDWATEVRGDPWDFEQGSDGSTVNANFSVSGGEGHGSTAGPTVNDPGLLLNLNGARIDAGLYHKLVFTIRYDGTWGLEDRPGAGMNARVLWHVAGTPGGSMQVSEDLVMGTWQRTYTVDLKTNPATAILDPAANPSKIGWGSGAGVFIDQLRLDPHEDRGARNWHIADVKLLRNESAAPGFNISYEDRSFTPGTTAEIVIDNDRDPNNGAMALLTSGHPVTAGVNTFGWNGALVGPGSYWIRLKLTNPSGVSTTVYSTGQAQVGQGASTAPPPPDLSGWIKLFQWLAFVCRPRPARVGRRTVMKSPCVKAAAPKRGVTRRRVRRR